MRIKDYIKRLFEENNKKLVSSINTSIDTKIEENVSIVSLENYYSEQEQVVGRWIDGKPIYQKTFTGTINPTNENFDEISTDVNIGASIDNFIDYSAFLYITDAGTFQTIYSRKKNNNTSVRIIFFNNNSTNTSNSFRINNAWFKEDVTITYIVTVQYTKTTDTVANISQIPNLYDISRPDMWPENQEIYFGNKLYGRRFTGNMIDIAMNTVDYIFLLPTGSLQNTARIISYGGSLMFRNTSELIVMLPVCSQQYNQSDGLFASTGLHKNQNGNLTLSVKCGTLHSVSTDTYDIWVTYIKE